MVSASHALAHHYSNSIFRPLEIGSIQSIEYTMYLSFLVYKFRSTCRFDAPVMRKRKHVCERFLALCLHFEFEASHIVAHTIQFQKRNHPWLVYGIGWPYNCANWRTMYGLCLGRFVYFVQITQRRYICFYLAEHFVENPVFTILIIITCVFIKYTYLICYHQ